MHRIDNDSASVTLPTPAAPGPQPNAFFKQKQSGVPGTTLTSDVLNAWQEEVCFVIEEAGLELDKTAQDQLLEAIQIMIVNGPSDSGIGAVFDDKSPKLGGELNLNDFIITSEANGDVEFAPATYMGPLDTGTAAIHTNIAHLGDLNNLIQFGTDTISHITNGVSRMDITASGLRLGGANSRVTTILNDSTMAADSDTALTTQAAYKAYVDAQIAKNAQVLMTWAGRNNTAGGSHAGWGLRYSGFAPNVGGGANVAAWTAPRSGTLKNLRVWLRRAAVNGSGFSVVYNAYIFKNGFNTALTVTDTRVGTLNEEFTLSNLSDTVSVSLGDKIAIHIVLNTVGAGVDEYYGTAAMVFE